MTVLFALHQDRRDIFNRESSALDQGLQENDRLRIFVGHVRRKTNFNPEPLGNLDKIGNDLMKTKFCWAFAAECGTPYGRKDCFRFEIKELEFRARSQAIANAMPPSCSSTREKDMEFLPIRTFNSDSSRFVRSP